jgi:hypothetical protein
VRNKTGSRERIKQQMMELCARSDTLVPAVGKTQ